MHDTGTEFEFMCCLQRHVHKGRMRGGRVTEENDRKKRDEEKSVQEAEMSKRRRKKTRQKEL